MSPTALVIDDDPRIRKLIEVGLRKQGFIVFTAENGRPGLKLFAQHQPDLVISDILMPEVEGIETIMTLKGAPNAPKIIAISGGGRLAGREFLKWAKHLGADEVMAKPFRLSALVATAQALLAERPALDLASRPMARRESPRELLPEAVYQRAALTVRRDRAFSQVAA